MHPSSEFQYYATCEKCCINLNRRKVDAPGTKIPYNLCTTCNVLAPAGTPCLCAKKCLTCVQFEGECPLDLLLHHEGTAVDNSAFDAECL